MKNEKTAVNEEFVPLTCRMWGTDVSAPGAILFLGLRSHFSSQYTQEAADLGHQITCEINKCMKTALSYGRETMYMVVYVCNYVYYSWLTGKDVLDQINLQKIAGLSKQQIALVGDYNNTLYEAGSWLGRSLRDTGVPKETSPSHFVLAKVAN